MASGKKPQPPASKSSKPSSSKAPLPKSSPKEEEAGSDDADGGDDTGDGQTGVRGPIDIFTSLKNILAAFQSGDTKAIWSAIRSIGDLIFGTGMTGTEGMHAGNMLGASHDEVSELVAEIQGCCIDKQNEIDACGEDEPKMMGAGPVGKIGDGKILGLIMKFLPLILAFMGPKPEGEE